MSEFPELQGYEPETGFGEKDLATRERELLGEDGAASLVGPHDNANTPTTSHVESDIDEGVPTTASEDEDFAPFAPTPSVVPGAGPSAYVPQKANLEESEFLRDWKVKNELEIERRDKVSSEKQEETQEKARKAIDEFYQNYNAKKDKEIEKVQETADEFIQKRDAEIGSGKGTTWDRISGLMDGFGRPADGVEPIDKKRFVELVESLKGDTNAPGAAGY